MNNYNEEEIIVQLQDPQLQREAFGKVVRHYSEQLYWQIRRMVLSHDDTNDLLQKITDEDAAAAARSAREIELVKTIYELKHTINQ